MKNSKRCIIILLTLVGSVSMARGKNRKRKEKPSTPYKYYYTLPVQAALTDWSYTVPECRSVSKEEYKFVDRKDNCQDNSEQKTKSCLSRIDVELKSLKKNEKKNFGLNYVIYDTMKACEEARASLVPASPDTAPVAPAAAPAATAPAPATSSTEPSEKSSTEASSESPSTNSASMGD